MNRLNGQQVTIGYGEHVIVSDLDVEIPDGKVTSIIDRTVAANRHCPHTISTKEIAKRLQFYRNLLMLLMDLQLVN